MTFSEFEAYSPIHDQTMTRVSVPDAQGREYWVLVPTYGKGYRERRNNAISLCEEAIAIGCDPGQVRVA